MTRDEFAGAGQESAHYATDFNRRLAAELVAMLPDDRDEARRVLAIIDHILSLELPPALLAGATR